MKKMLLLLLLFTVGCNFIKETNTIVRIANKVGKKNDCTIGVSTNVTNGYSKVTFTVQANSDDVFLPGKVLSEIVTEMKKKFINYDEYLVVNGAGTVVLAATDDQMDMVTQKKQIFEKQVRSVKSRRLSEFVPYFSPELAREAMSSPKLDSTLIGEHLRFSGFSFEVDDSVNEKVALLYSNGEQWLMMIYDQVKGNQVVSGIEFRGLEDNDQ